MYRGPECSAGPTGALQYPYRATRAMSEFLSFIGIPAEQRSDLTVNKSCGIEMRCRLGLGHCAPPGALSSSGMSRVCSDL